jgi:ribosomal protein S18 acetylase RimI-like enzyme
VTIRPATAGDIPAIVDIVDRAYGGYVSLIGRRPGPMDDDYSARVGSGEVFVACDAGGRLCGLIVLVPAADHVLIENVAVDPELQGSGIGRRLLAFAEEFASRSGLAEIRLYTNVKMTSNQRLYRSLGFEETGRRIGREFARVYFTKRLDSPSRQRGVA